MSMTSIQGRPATEEETKEILEKFLEEHPNVKVTDVRGVKL